MNIEKVKKLEIPKKPGCYFFKDENGEIIYIGKASDLRSRVLSYWREGTSHSPAKYSMMKKINKVEWIEVESEIEALLLESNLIKKHQPNYNIIMRDDKRHVYIKISTEDVYPRVFMTRQLDKAGKYFGPFVSVEAVRETLKVIRKIWPYRSCKNMPNKVCLYYRIGKCQGVCEEIIDKNKYTKTIKQIMLFLDGKKEKVVKDIEREVKRLEVGVFKNNNKIFNKINTDSSSRHPNLKQCESEGYSDSSSRHSRPKRSEGEGNPDIRTSSSPALCPPREESSAREGDPDFSSCPREETSVKEGNPDLSFCHSRRRAPARREGNPENIEKEINQLKFKLINLRKVLGHTNILSLTDKYSSDVIELAKVLGLSKVPNRIEGYDISNIFGKQAVGSMVVFEEGEPNKNEYRKFKIKNEEGGDIGMLKEMLERRIKHSVTENSNNSVILEGAQATDGIPCHTRRHPACPPLEGAQPKPARPSSGGDPAPLSVTLERSDSLSTDRQESSVMPKPTSINNKTWPLPDLIIIDGGKGQLNTVLRIIKKFNLDITTIAVSKGEGLRSAKAPDKIFFPGEKKPLELPLSSPALHVIKRVRDEAHRFAITYHKKLRSKRAFM